MKKAILCLGFLILVSNFGFSQCLQTTLFPSAAIVSNNSGAPQSLSTCSFTSEYANLIGLNIDGTYIFKCSTAGAVVQNFVTVTDVNNGVIAFGNSPLTVANMPFAQVRVHFSEDALCASANSCHATTVQFVNQCPNPGEIGISNISASTAEITWSSVGGEVGWEVLVLPAAAGAPLATDVGIVVNTADYLATGLMANNSYNFFVRRICPGLSNFWRAASSFTTQCIAVDTIVENFDNYANLSLPPCWQKSNNVAVASVSNLVAAVSGTQSLRLQSAIAALATVALPAVSNLASGTNLLQFKAKTNGTAAALEVGYLTNINDVSTFVGVAWISILANSDWSSYSLQTPMTSNPSALLYFRNGTFSSNIYIDDVSWASFSGCAYPINLPATGITSSSAMLHWQSNSNDLNSGFEYYVSSTNVAPTSSAFPTGVTVETSVLVSNLVPATQYFCWVRSVCDANNSSVWSFSQSFITNVINDNCDVATVLSVDSSNVCSQGFSGTTFGASASVDVFENCTGVADDDVWFEFTATSNTHIISITGDSDFNHVLYSGGCGALTPIFCSNPNVSMYNNFVVGNLYKLRVFTALAATNAIFSICITTPLSGSVVNDECNTATAITINNDVSCNSVAYGTLIGASPSNVPNGCVGIADDDVWFSFVALSQHQIIALTDLSGGINILNHAVYSGSCGSLNTLVCSPVSTLKSDSSGYIIGQTYYLRIWSNGAISVPTNFSICVKSVSTCQTATPFCGSSPEDPYIFSNTTQVSSGLGGVACLFSTPNPTFYTLHVGQSGPLLFNMLQNTAFDALGNPIGTNLDVDFVAWGPFSSAQSCEQITFSTCSTCPNNTTNALFYPFGNIVDCSFSGSYTETVSIPNALEGEYYVILITNFNGQAGDIKLVQTNYNDTTAGATFCGDKIQLLAFVDANNNGVKESTELNFTYGSFVIQKNNADAIFNISSPIGKHNIFDENPLNTYDFSYQINPEYAAYFTVAPTNFNDISIAVGSGTTTINFPMTMVQPFTDVAVSIVPIGNPVPGFSYQNKIIYKNLGMSTVSGTISFSKNPYVSITSVSEPGAVSSENGFDFAFNNLAPFETKTVIVEMAIPAIPVVNINDVLTNSVNINTTETDIQMSNNSFSSSQVVFGAFDPNDKTESHGGAIQHDTFGADGELFYTVRFQNTGTSNALTVRVEDVLDAQLDEQSIRMIGASHNYTMSRVDNKIVWTFNDIQLPASVQSEAASHGYVFFSIKLKPGFAIGDVVSNVASIYFDTNPPILTNTCNTEFVAVLKTNTFESSFASLFPNPTHDFVQISMVDLSDQLKSVSIIDMLGKTVKKIANINSKIISVSILDLSKGVYTVTIDTENGLKQVKKLIVN